MPFMVIYRTSDGSSGYEQAGAIDEAALFVERLRNSDGIDQIRIYRMEEINFAFRPYYKVELGLPEHQSVVPPPLPEDVSTVEGPLASTPEPDGPVAGAALTRIPAEPAVPAPPGGDDDAAGANGRRGLFGR